MALDCQGRALDARIDDKRTLPAHPVLIRSRETRLEEQAELTSRQQLEEEGGACELVFVDGCAGRFGWVCGGKAKEVRAP